MRIELLSYTPDIFFEFIVRNKPKETNPSTFEFRYDAQSFTVGAYMRYTSNVRVYHLIMIINNYYSIVFGSERFAE